MKFYLLLFVLAILFASCEKESECVKCNEAIQHMAQKINQFGCNPNYMENARQRIKDDCGEYRGNAAVGYLAEDCAFNYNGYLGCTEIATGLSMNDGAGRTFQLYYLSSLADDTINVQMGDSYDYSNGTAVNLPSFSSAQLELDQYHTIEEGSVYFVLIVNTVTADTLYKGQQTLTYHRPNNWSAQRTIAIEYDQVLMDYTVDFENW